MKYALLTVALFVFFAGSDAGRRRHGCCGSPCGPCGGAPLIAPPIDPCGFSPCGPPPLIMAPPVYIPPPQPIIIAPPIIAPPIFAPSPCCCRKSRHLRRRSCGSPCAGGCGGGLLG